VAVIPNDPSKQSDDEIVSLGDLRPSREHFGPVPPKKTTASKQSGNNAKAGGRKPKPRPQAAKNESGRPSRPQEGNVRYSKGASASQAGGRKASTASGRPAHRSSGRPDQRAGGRNGSQSPRKRDEFANRLAATDKAPVSVKPISGWRGAVLRATAGTVNLGPSADERTELKLRHQVRRPVTDGTVAVFSRKGGVGKTTISAYLGLTLAHARGGRIVALDGDAEAGSLGWLLTPHAPATLADLACAEPMPADYASLRHYMTTTAEGLDVIVGEPAEVGPISTVGLEAVASQLARHYDLSIFDTGAGVTRATGRVLVNSARTLLLVMGPSIDSVRAAERTLAWLDERPGEAADPDARVVAVINGIPTNAKKAHIDRIASHFHDRAAAVVRIPWDTHLAEGNTSVSLDRLAKPTRRAFLELAAVTVGTLAHPVRRSGYNMGARRAS